MTGIGPTLAGGTGLEGVLAGGSGVASDVGITDLVHHWDASDGVSTTTLLIDQVSGFNLSGSTIGSTTVNGRNAFARGIQANCGFRKVSGSSQIAGESVWGCFWVGVAAAGTGGCLFDTRTTGTGTNGAHAHGVAGGNLWAMYASSSRTYGGISNGVHTHYVEWNGASSRWILDGVLLTPSGSIGTMSTGPGITILNTYNFGLGAPSGLTICESKICIGTQSDDAITTELNALKLKWGTP